MYLARKVEIFEMARAFIGLSVRLSFILVLSGCGSMLPDAQETTTSPWKGFEDAKAAYAKIEPGTTTLAGLKRLGFDPYATPNVKILSYLDVIARFLPNDSIKMEDLDPGVRTCIAARESCGGYEINPSDVHSERVGDIFTDMFNFKRTIRRKGWSFHALIIFDRETVVYKIWRGSPVIEGRSRKRNPLGPLQDSGGLLIRQVVP